MQIADVPAGFYSSVWSRSDQPRPASTVQPPASEAEAADSSANTDVQSTQAVTPAQAAAKSTELEQAEQLELTSMIKRDQEVRQHEQAHSAIGGRHAGAPSYTYERGPDGKRYAVAGEVSIDVSAVPDDPQATLIKMEQVIRAALAPAEPSAQDRQVAAQAQIQLAQARAEVAQQRLDEAEAVRAARREQRADDKQDESGQTKSPDVAGTDTPASVLELYQQIRAGSDQLPLIDLSI